MRWQPKAPAAAVAASASASAAPSQEAASSRGPGPGPSLVAVIGGGVAGLACGKRLGQLGIKAVVFDTGKRGPGGRASSRVWRGQCVDHAAQFIPVTDPGFAHVLREPGVARRWGHDGRFGKLGKAGFTPLEDGVERWIGVEGMGSIINALARDVDVRQDIWVPPSNGIRATPEGIWLVAAPDKRTGRGQMRFDAVVIAHNGKCAERLTSGTPALEVHALLRTNFSAFLPRNPAPGSGKFTLNQVYSLLFEAPAGLMPTHFDAAFVENEPTLRWLSSNSAKLGRKEGASPDSEVWTVLSSAPFGKQHKAPQEHLEGTPKEAEVIKLLLQAVERAVGLEGGKLAGAVSATKLQLWGAALPINRWVAKDGSDYAWSAAHRIGIAGDWLAPSPERASTIEGAWLSGVHLAEHIAGASGADAGIELGEEGGVFVPIEGDFGGAGSNAAAWVTPPSPEEVGRGWEGVFQGGGGKGRDVGRGKGAGGSAGRGREDGQRWARRA